MNVFYSWQSDVDAKTNRYFIRDALQAAIKQISAENDVEDADRPELDDATTGTVGMADITRSIIDKINACACFVADVTPVVRAKNGRRIPNPNVMYELGLASQAPGYELCIGVMNTNGNPGPSCLPFDLRNRLVIAYKLANDASPEERKQVRTQLSGVLASAIKKNLAAAQTNASALKPIVMTSESFQDRSIWDTANNGIIISNPYRGSPTTFTIPTGTRSYLRVIPSGYRDGIPSGLAIDDHRTLLQSPPGSASSGDHGPCEQGYCSIWYHHNDGHPLLASGSMYFDTTGELWLTDSSPLYQRSEERFWSPPRMLRNWRAILNNYIKLLDELGANERRLLVAGAVGLKGSQFHLNGFDRAWGLKDEVRHEQELRKWEEVDVTAFLTAAYNKVLASFALSPITTDDLSKVIERG